jgi:anti-sigma factor RsiW
MPNDDTSIDLMSCEMSRDRLGAYLDGELPVDERQGVAAHLAKCTPCSVALSDYERIGRSLRQSGGMAAPSALGARVRMALDRVDADNEKFADQPVRRLPAHLGFHASTGFAAQAVVLAASCLVSILATWLLVTSTTRSATLEHDLLTAHIRSLLQDSPVQVASSDQHTVRPWFAGRADFAPSVKDLVTDGFPLLGGRLDYVAERRAGVLVYKRRLHLINVFMWSTVETGDTAPRATFRNGYTMLSWTRSGVTYSAVSDVNVDELRTLQQLL